MTLSVVLPCFNEEGNIERTVRDTASWLASQRIDGEVIVTDDGSRDHTPEILRKLANAFSILRVVTHPVNQGYGAAVRSGCDAAGKEYIAFMDSDGQFHAEDLLRLMPHLSEVDFVAGTRLKRADPIGRIVSARLGYLLVRLVLGVQVKDLNCAMKIFKRSLWPAIRPVYGTGPLFNAEIFLRLSMAGIPWVEVGVPHYPRTVGVQSGGSLPVIRRMFRELTLLRQVRRQS